MTWKKEENSFPFIPVGATTNIPYGNTFLTIGGHFDGNNVDWIYMVI